MVRSKSAVSLLSFMSLFSLTFFLVGTCFPRATLLESQQTSMAGAADKIEIENATQSLSVIDSTTRLMPVSASGIQNREVTLTIRNNHKSRVTAILLELPSEGRGRRSHGRDYFMSRSNPTGLQTGEIDSIRVVVASTPPFKVRIAAALLAGEGSDGEGRGIAMLRSVQRGKIYETEKAIAIFNECFSNRQLNAWDTLQMIRNKITQLEDQLDPADESFNNGANTVKMGLLDWAEGAFSRAQESSDITASLKARLVEMQNGIAAIK
jgi:hypothetical protein